MIALIPAAIGDRPVLDNLMQLYAYDWSELGHPVIGETGRFDDYPLDAWWVDDWRYPFLVRVDGKLAGFALVLGRSRLSGRAGIFDMAEFFVLRAYRRCGVGTAAAVAAFDRFRGGWEIRQRPENLPAIAFWRRTIAQYTRGNYDDVAWNDATWTGPVQSFSSAIDRPTR